MQQSQGSSSYMRTLFLFNHGAGLVVGAVFPFFSYLMLGEEALTVPFFLSCLVAGLGLGTAAFWFVRRTLKFQLQQQLAALRQLTGEQAAVGVDQSVEGLFAAVNLAVEEVHALISCLHGTVDEFVPHYQTLADASRFLSARAEDGLQAAKVARADVESVHQKQQAVMGQVEHLNDRSQDEAALSRELSASLEEMAGALEHSSQNFLETTHNVDQLVSSIRTATSQAEQVAHTMENTASALDGISEAMETLRDGVVKSAEGAEDVKRDAEEGVVVVSNFTGEMNRIDEESRKAITAMQRLSRQTAEVTKIIEVIKDLVSDTELLAFNAAIIAAKAGAEGRGFSVVAEEIRDLADRTANSAEEIEAIIKSIGKDTAQVSASVESTGHFIGKGMNLSHSTGDALRKIVQSSSEAASVSQALANRTSEQGLRVRNLIGEAGSNLRSVRAIAQSVQQQEASVGQIHAGVSEMKAAADKIARGFDEQVKANHEFDRGLSAREDQVQAIFEATKFQMEAVNRILEHFSNSEARLAGNAARTRVIDEELAAMEVLEERLRDLAASFQLNEKAGGATRGKDRTVASEA